MTDNSGCYSITINPFHSNKYYFDFINEKVCLDLPDMDTIPFNDVKMFMNKYFERFYKKQDTRISGYFTFHYESINLDEIPLEIFDEILSILIYTLDTDSNSEYAADARKDFNFKEYFKLESQDGALSNGYKQFRTIKQIKELPPSTIKIRKPEKSKIEEYKNDDTSLTKYLQEINRENQDKCFEIITLLYTFINTRFEKVIQKYMRTYNRERDFYKEKVSSGYEKTENLCKFYTIEDIKDKYLKQKYLKYKTKYLQYIQNKRKDNI
jgi:hypothetical protein